MTRINMNHRKTIKMLLDIVMTIALLFLMAFQVTGDTYHEWIGAGMLLLFVIHNGLNWNWYRAAFKGKYSLQRVLRTVINLAALVAIVLTGYSGIVMSRHVFAFLTIAGGLATARQLHLAGSYWSFVLMSIHLGMHWIMLTGKMKMSEKSNDNQDEKKHSQKIVILWALRIAAFAVAIYGAILFGRMEIFRNMFLQNEFAIMDYETSGFFVILQNLAMMSMWVFVGHYLTKALVKLSIRGSWHNADRNREVKQRNKFRGVVSIIAAVAVICCGVISTPRMQTAESWQNTTNTEEPIVDTVVNTTNGLIEETDNSKSNILIAYFSWADNTEVMDEEAAIESALEHYQSVGDQGNYTDAISSASIVKPGNVSKMADWIQQRVGGDLFPIVVAEPYPGNYDECLERAADEKAGNARPELVNHVENMDDYDVIFLGFPNWWYTAPMAIFSFIEEYDLSGKTIIPFCAHGTGGIAGSVRDITDALPESTQVLEPIGVYRADINSAQPEVNDWLDTLGFTEAALDGKSDTDKTDFQESEVRTMRMSVDGQDVTITLNDTPLANALYDMLPLELTFEDFNGTEKITYLPEGQSLSTEGLTGGHEPVAGDLCLYAPWGNLCIFYKDFHYSDDLYFIGHVENGIDVLSGMNSDFTVTLE